MNILLIFADQMHRYALGKMSHFVHTPNLDKLCEQGVRFTNAYSNNPICTPFRGSLFTGMYGSHSGVVDHGAALPQGVITLADSYNAAGYNTSFVGKWHLGANGNCPIPKPLRGGFQKFIGYQCYNGFRDNVCFYDEYDREHRFNKHRTQVETELAIQRLKELCQEGKPFLHVVAYQAPHYPVQPSETYEKLYSNKVIPTTPDYKEVDPYTPTYSPPSPSNIESDPDYQNYGSNMQRYLQLYYAMVSEVDEGIGQILGTLDELNVREETIVIFTSDHGDMQGSHGWLNKCLPYEKSSGIPMIMSVPKGRHNTVSTALVSGIDLYPTLLELTGLPQEAHLEGKSLARYLKGDKDILNYPVCSEFCSRGEGWKMIRYGDYKLVIDWSTRKPTMLFNLCEDPYEMHNLVHDEEYHAIICELLELMEI